MSVEIFIFVILAAMLIFAIVRKLLYLAVVVIVLYVAYQLGIVEAIINLFNTQLLPLIPEGIEWSQFIPFPSFL